MSTKQLPATQTRPHGTLPPEERFWQRYSGQHEFSLSASSSLMAHGLLVAAIAGLGFLSLRLGLHDSGRALAVDPVALEQGLGGEHRGSGAALETEAVGEPDKKPAVPTPAQESLPEVPSEQLAVPPSKERDDRAVREETEALLRRLLRNRVGERVGVAQEPTGNDKDKKKPDATGGISPDQKRRILRWTLMFNTKDGDDYRKQLIALGAILAIPAKEGQPYQLIRDLNKLPAKGEHEDITKIDRIFWVDDKADSVRSLSGALQLEEVPKAIVAFFPKKVEDELLRKELAYKNRKENEIKETRFNVVKRGDTYEAVVVEQR